MFDNIVKVCEMIVMILIGLMFLWVGISWIDVLIHSLDTNGWTYPYWNFFTYFL